MKQNVALTVAEGSIYLALDQLAKPSPGISGTANNPLQDMRVRETLSLASDSEAIVGQVMDAVAVVAAVL